MSSSLGSYLETFRSFVAGAAPGKTADHLSPTLFDQFDQMTKRVFRPEHAIRRAELYLRSTWQETGLIGTDKHYQFHTHLKNSAGQAFQGKPNDHYAWVQIKPLEYPCHAVFKVIESILKKVFFFIRRDFSMERDHLPASLFEGKKEGDTVSFSWDGTPVEFTLKQLSHNHEGGRRNFEDFFKELQEQPKKEFLFSEDIPINTLHIGLTPLGSNTQALIGNQPLVPVTTDNIKKFEDFLMEDVTPTKGRCSSNPDNYTIFIDAPVVQQEDINILCDDHFVFFGATKKWPEFLGLRKIQASIPLRITVDTSKITYKLENGCVEITIPYKNN